jgi:ABC-type multidrug transport system permease subunit
VRRDFANIRSYRFPFVLDTVFGILQLAVYYFLSETFGGVSSADLNGAPNYFAFAAVGAVIALVIESSVQGVAERVRQGQVTGSLEALMAQPVNAFQLCLALTAFPFAFAVVRATLYLIVAGAFMDLDLSNTDWVGLGVVFLIVAAAVASIGVFAGAVVLVFKRGEVITGMLVFGMTLITGAVFPVSALPDWLEAIGGVLPLSFAFDGARDALFEGSGWESDALALTAFAVVALPVAMWTFVQALRAVRKTGTLGQY